MVNRQIAKTYIHVPGRPRRTFLRTAAHAIKGMSLGPLYWLAAALSGGPGLRFRWRCFVLGTRTLLRFWRLPLSTSFHLLFMPMDSTRYFEFDFVARALAQHRLRRYLDISSPRLMPLMLLDTRDGLAADLINPNPEDLADTARLVEFIGAADRCRLHGCLIADAPFEPATFDAITSISVLEHIPDDLAALKRMWNLLRPGGMLVLTVPCMAQAAEQYIDRDEWGLLAKDSEGYIFWQRLYDQRMLQERIFPVTGNPLRMVVFGEKTAGTMTTNAARKRSDPDYPYWREPYMMAKDFRYFESVDDLPGEGVAGMVFVKQP